MRINLLFILSSPQETGKENYEEGKTLTIYIHR